MTKAGRVLASTPHSAEVDETNFATVPRDRISLPRNPNDLLSLPQLPSIRNVKLSDAVYPERSRLITLFNCLHWRPWSSLPVRPSSSNLSPPRCHTTIVNFPTPMGDGLAAWVGKCNLHSICPAVGGSVFLVDPCHDLPPLVRLGRGPQLSR